MPLLQLLRMMGTKVEDEIDEDSSEDIEADEAAHGREENGLSDHTSPKMEK